MNEAHAAVVQLTKMLKNLDRWLDKAVEHAEKKSFDPEVLLSARLAPDMYPLMRQLQAACDGVKFLAARLAGKDAPKHPDTETTLEQIRSRLRAVVEYAESFEAKDFAEAESRVVPLGFMPGKGTKAGEYRLAMASPNTYFHIVTAYAILRHNGVPLGKIDYIGSLDIQDL
jgi:hypothetical protein